MMLLRDVSSIHGLTNTMLDISPGRHHFLSWIYLSMPTWWITVSRSGLYRGFFQGNRLDGSWGKVKIGTIVNSFLSDFLGSVRSIGSYSPKQYADVAYPFLGYFYHLISFSHLGKMV